MSRETPVWMRRRSWLVAGILAFMMLGAFMYATSRSPDRMLPFADPGVPAPDPAAVAVPSAPPIVSGELAESLARTLERRLDEWNRRGREAAAEERRTQARALEDWREELDGQALEQLTRLTDIDRRLGLLERDMTRLLDSLEEEAAAPGARPSFTFRGIEVWHGQAYALLEHEGRILPVRQGESRLGWRVHAIDREHRKLHVGDGMTELVLEEQ